MKKKTILRLFFFALILSIWVNWLAPMYWEKVSTDITFRPHNVISLKSEEETNTLGTCSYATGSFPSNLKGCQQVADSVRQMAPFKYPSGKPVMKIEYPTISPSPSK